MLHPHGALLLVLWALVLPGCRKEKDDTRPDVRILAPGAGTVIAVPDSLLVRVQVSDDRIVERLWISLTDANGVPVGPVISEAPQSTSALVERVLRLTDEGLLSGTYTLAVRASDGVNEGRAFRTVQVQEAPLRARALFIATVSGTGAATVQKLDSAGTLSPFSAPGDLSAMVCAPRDRTLVVAGGAWAPLLALGTETAGTHWQVANPGAQGLPYFMALVRDPLDGRIYFATEDGYIRGYDGSGVQRYTGQNQLNQRTTGIAVLGDRLATLQEAIGGPEKRLVVYPTAAGPPIAWFVLDLDPVGILRRDDLRVLIAGNRNGLGVVQDRNTQPGGAQDLRQFDAPILAMARMGPQDMALALGNGVYRYRWTTNSLVPLLPGVQASCLAFDEANGRLHAGAGATVYSIDALNGGAPMVLQVGEPVGSLAVLLNR
jgi:hypothetical protein